MRFGSGGAVATGLMWALTACGGDKAPDSTVQGSQAGGGMGGSGGGLVLETGGGGAASKGGAGAGAGGNTTDPPGGAPSIVLHTCPTQADAPCPPKGVSGDVSADSEAALTALAGVTSIEGRLRITSDIGLDALSCLETVGDDLEISLSGSDGDTSLWGLRNVKSVGGSLEISDRRGSVYPDCAFSRLESLGESYLTGGAIESTRGLAGTLDVPALKGVRHIRISDSALTRITLPSDRPMLVMGQLALENNWNLAEVLGFTGVTIKQSGIQVSGAYSVRIVQNPKLSECRAHELEQLFLNAGYAATTMTVTGNAPCSE